MKTYKMAASFKLNHADFPPLLNSTVSKPVSFFSSSLSCAPASRSFSNKVSSISFKSLTKASDKPFPWITRFCPGDFAPKHLHNPSQLLTFDLACNVSTKLKHYIICKSVMSFELINVNVNFAAVSVCQRVNVVRLFFCHPHVPFLAKPLFATVNLHRTVTVHDVNYFSYQRCQNITSFPQPSSNLLSSPGIKSHLSL